MPKVNIKKRGSKRGSKRVSKRGSKRVSKRGSTKVIERGSPKVLELVSTINNYNIQDLFENLKISEVKSNQWDVVELTDTMFKNMKNGHNKYDTFLVEFYAPWCPVCVRFENNYENFSIFNYNKYKNFEEHGIENNVLITKIDSSKYKELESSEGIKSYPTIKLYTTQSCKGYRNPIQRKHKVFTFTGNRNDNNELYEFIQNNRLDVYSRNVLELENNRAITFFNSDMSNEWLSKKIFVNLLMFYNTECEECDRLGKIFEELGKYYKNLYKYKELNRVMDNKKTIVSKMNTNVDNRYRCHTIILYKAHGEVIMYNSSMDKYNIFSFIENNRDDK